MPGAVRYSVEQEPPTGGGRILRLGRADHRGDDCACRTSQHFQALPARNLLSFGRCGVSLHALGVPRGLDEGAATSLLESGGGVTAEDEPVDCSVVRVPGDHVLRGALAEKLGPGATLRVVDASHAQACRKANQIIRDMFIFTNRQLVFVNRQEMSGKKAEYQSIPYRSIIRFSVETAGHFDRDAELKIWLSGTPAPLQLQFNRTLNIYEVQTVLASYVVR